MGWGFFDSCPFCFWRLGYILVRWDVPYPAGALFCVCTMLLTWYSLVCIFAFACVFLVHFFTGSFSCFLSFVFGFGLKLWRWIGREVANNFYLAGWVRLGRLHGHHHRQRHHHHIILSMFIGVVLRAGFWVFRLLLR